MGAGLPWRTRRAESRYSDGHSQVVRKGAKGHSFGSLDGWDVLSCTGLAKPTDLEDPPLGQQDSSAGVLALAYPRIRNSGICLSSSMANRTGLGVSSLSGASLPALPAQLLDLPPLGHTQLFSLRVLHKLRGFHLGTSTHPSPHLAFSQHLLTFAHSFSW